MKNIGKAFALKCLEMSSLENIYQKMAPELTPTVAAPLPPQSPNPESSSAIGRELAHELNNILTVVQGYADRMLMKHGENPALRPDLQLISDNTRRAVSAIRQARKPAAPVAV